MTHVFCTQFEYSSVHLFIHSFIHVFIHSFIENVSIIHLSISISRKAYQLCRDVETGERRGLSVPDIAAKSAYHRSKESRNKKSRDRRSRDRRSRDGQQILGEHEKQRRRF